MSLEAKSLLIGVTLLIATLASGQRSSPQFSFPPPGSLASQFGSDVFHSPNGQDFGLLQQAGQPNLAVPEVPQVNSAVLGSEHLPSQHHQLIAQSVDGQQQQQQHQPQQLLPQQQQPQQPQQPQQQQLHSQHQHQQAPQVAPVAQPVAVQQPARQQEPASVQVARVAQASAPQQSVRSSSGQATVFVPVAPQASLPAASAVASQAVAVSERQSQPARHRSSQSFSPQPQAQPQPQPQQHHHRERSSHNPSNNNNLQTQQTSQSLSGSTSQAAIDTARRAEATAASLAATSSQNYQCPDSFGYFRHHKSCDKYWACENGTSTLKLCGNGLMFDDSDPKRENCAYPFSVDCGSDRTDLEPPISTPHCPRLYGLFADSANCRVFYSCWNGESSKYECPPGLAYDNEQRVCVWADLVDRCDQSEVSDGFVCPDPTEVDQPGHYTRHAHPTDCRKFYVCIEGVARPYGCSLGTVFNVDSLQCDEPENVSGCEKYYGDLDPKLAKKLAVLGVEKEQPKNTNQGPTERGSTAPSVRAPSQAN